MALVLGAAAKLPVTMDPKTVLLAGDLPVRKSAHFRAAPIDNAIVHAQSDGMATAIVVNLVRRHLNWKSMRRKENSDSRPPEFELQGPQEVVKEFEALVAPHQAQKIAHDILDCLNSLTPEERRRYGIVAPESSVQKSNDDD